MNAILDSHGPESSLQTEPVDSAEQTAGQPEGSDGLGISVRDVAGVDVYQWNPLRDDGTGTRRLVDNFGDLLGPMIVERMLWRRQSAGTAPDSPRRRLLSVGSVLHQAREADVVWGAGVNGKLLGTYPSSFPKVDVRAVRGPWTARLLTSLGIDVPVVFGDPALLLPRLLPELSTWTHAPATDTLVVPNLHDVDAFRDSEHTVLNPRGPVHTVLRTIARSRFVVGSSLHAVIVADSLGIPARFVASGTEDPFKYRDYLAGTGRATTRIARDVAEALRLGGHEAPAVDLDALEDAFPWDLWGLPRTDPENTDAFEVDDVQEAWRERVVAGGGPAARAAFLSEELPRLRAAVTSGAPEAPGLVISAADRVTHVIPDVLDEPLDAATRHLMASVLRRDVGLVATAAHLESAPPVAMLHAARPLGTHTLLSVALLVPETVGPDDVELVLTPTGDDGTGTVVTLPILLFAQARRQWHVLTDVVVPHAALAANAWRVEARIGDRRLPVHHASPGELTLSAPAAGRTPALGEQVVLAADGTVQSEENTAS